MAGYTPKKIAGMASGLVTQREKFLLPDDAYPQLINAYVWREKIVRKAGFTLLGRLRRNLTSPVTLSTQASGSSYSNADIFADSAYNLRATQPNALIVLGSMTVTVGADVFVDTTNTGVLTSAAGSGTINYATGALTLTFTVPLGSPTNIQVVVSYYPSLPTMGICTRTLDAINSNTPVIFDTIYAYEFNGSTFQELITGTTWSGSDSDFFWSTNWWTGVAGGSLFWVTNYSGTSGDPIRYTDGTTWTDFAPQIDAAGNLLTQALIILPFRGRLLALNTLEGMSLNTSKPQQQTIRWSAIGSPFTTNAWRDDIVGQGGFLNIPTTELIIAAGFVRDNLVIYCQSSTWQLRYTGRSINPFQIEKVNTELGSQSTFSAVQFDTSLVGIGDKGIVQCDSFKSERIDIKIVDFFLTIDQLNQGAQRVAGIRDFAKKIAYWIYPDENSPKFPNNRLIYNYENESWAIFTDSLTALGSYQPTTDLTWEDTTETWQDSNFTWRGNAALQLQVIGGNQQGYVFIVDDEDTVSNAVSLSITNVAANVITVPNHNLQTGFVVQIANIPAGTPGSSLNGGIFGVVVSVSDPNNQFSIFAYNPTLDAFDITPVVTPSGTYIGGGQIILIENFSIMSKAFNYMDEGQNIQVGYIDALIDTTSQGAVTLNVYQNYDNVTPTNTYPDNVSAITGLADPFFNSVVPTTAPPGALQFSTKTWQRVFCPTRANFLTFEWTLSNAQLVGVEQLEDFEIGAQIIWMRPAGRMTSI